MEHYKSRTNDFFHFTNPHDDISDLDDDPYHELQYYDVDDDRSCDFNLDTYRPLGIHESPPAHVSSQTSGVMNWNDTVEFGDFDNAALVFQLDNTMKNISDKILHRIEGIGTQITHLEDETCKLDYCVEDVKNCEERYHETTHRKLRHMQSILQERFTHFENPICYQYLGHLHVKSSLPISIFNLDIDYIVHMRLKMVQDGVKCLRDKHDIADMQLQLAILRGSKREKINIPPHQSCITPFLNHQDLQFQHYIQSQLSNTSFTQISIPRNYKSEFQAKYMPEFANYSNTYGGLSSSYETSNMKPAESVLPPEQEISGSDSIHTHIAQWPQSQTLPYALPTAIDVTEESRSVTNRNTAPIDDVVNKVTEMGFRRDLVRACVRKLTVNGSPVDFNSVLDQMMKNK